MVAALVVVGTLSSPANDKFWFWYSGHLVAQGSSPYDSSLWSAAASYGDIAVLVARSCVDVFAHQCLWVYPPWTAWLFAPFGFLDPEPGIALQSAFLLVAAGASLVLLVREIRMSRPSTMFLLLASVGSAPFVWDSFLGHFGPLELAGAVLVARGLRTGGAAPTVGGGMLLALKPHVSFLVVPVVVAILIGGRRWRLLATTALCFALLAVVALWREPRALSALGGAGVKTAEMLPTIWSFAAQVTPEAPLATVFATLVVATIAAYRSVRATPGPLRQMVMVAVAIALSLAVTPFEHLYDHLLLLPCFAVIVSVTDRVGRAVRLAGWGMVIALVALGWWAFLTGPHGDETPALSLLPMITLVALAAATHWTRQTRSGASAPDRSG